MANEVLVSTGALLKRINRALQEYDQVVRTSRSERARFDLGRFYLVNTSVNGICGKYVDLEETGRELGVLADYERWRDEEDETAGAVGA